jgi:hypothetical protein
VVYQEYQWSCGAVPPELPEDYVIEQGETVTLEIEPPPGVDAWLATIDWGDGDTSLASEGTVAHTYVAPQSVLVKLSAQGAYTTPDGVTRTCVDQGDVGRVTVEGPMPPPEPVSCGTSFPQLPTNYRIEVGETVSLTFVPPPGVVQWSAVVNWNEGGNTSTTSGGEVSYTYRFPLIYRILATATGELTLPNGAVQPCADAADLGFVTVQATPADADGDGVPDAQDKCPRKAGYAATDGCPASKSKLGAPPIDVDLPPTQIPGGKGVRKLPQVPFIIDSQVQESSWDLLPGEASRDDWIQFVFTESMKKGTLHGNGVSYHLYDTDGTVLVVVCGTNATCATNGGRTGQTHSGQLIAHNQLVGVILGPNASPQGGTIPGLQWPAQLEAIIPLPQDAQQQLTDLSSSTDLEVNEDRVY